MRACGASQWVFFKLIFSLFLTVPILNSSCGDYLFIDQEFRELIKIAEVNKNRRSALMNSKKESREALVREHLFESVIYEQNKIGIYIRMLEKILQRKGTPSATAYEIKRRLLRSLSFYEQLSDSLTESHGIEASPLWLEMSPQLSRFISSKDSL